MKQKLAKYKLRISPLYLIAVILFFAMSCEEENVDTTPPGVVSNVSYEALNGGAKISYTLPSDNDLLYVRAEYTNTLGEEVFKVSSRYSTVIEIDGFNDTEAHNVRLYAVDQDFNKSEAVEIQITPLVSFIHLVKESITIDADFGGVKVKWNNPAEKTVFVYLYYDNNVKERERILSSSSVDEAYIVRGMESIEYGFSIMVEDFNGNKTEKLFVNKLTPLFEEKIDKATWTLVSDLSINGNAYEGETVNFWDDIIDTKDNPEDNSYFIINRDDNGGILSYPLDIVIDLNKKAIVNRFAVWQRAYEYIEGNNGVSENYYYYKNENMRSFELLVSNDKINWTSVGSFDIGDPRDEDGVVPPNKIQEAIDGHAFDLPEVTTAFRYLKFSITSSFGSETNVYGSEITLYGSDNVVE